MGAGCRVCASVWRGGVIRFPWLIFCFSPLVSWNTPGRAPARENRCDHQRRQQDETQEGAWSPNIWQGKASMTRSTSGWKKKKKKKALRSAGIKVCPGCLSHRGLPQHIQMGFPERSRSHKQTLEHKRGRKRREDEYLKICALSTQNKWSVSKAHGGRGRGFFFFLSGRLNRI